MAKDARLLAEDAGEGEERGRERDHMTNCCCSSKLKFCFF